MMLFFNFFSAHAQIRNITKLHRMKRHRDLFGVLFISYQDYACGCGCQDDVTLVFHPPPHSYVQLFPFVAEYRRLLNRSEVEAFEVAVRPTGLSGRRVELE